MPSRRRNTITAHRGNNGVLFRIRSQLTSKIHYVHSTAFAFLTVIISVQQLSEQEDAVTLQRLLCSEKEISTDASTLCHTHSYLTICIMDSMQDICNSSIIYESRGF